MQLCISIAGYNPRDENGVNRKVVTVFSTRGCHFGHHHSIRSTVQSAANWLCTRLGGYFAVRIDHALPHRGWSMYRSNVQRRTGHRFVCESVEACTLFVVSKLFLFYTLRLGPVSCRRSGRYAVAAPDHPATTRFERTKTSSSILNPVRLFH